MQSVWSFPDPDRAVSLTFPRLSKSNRSPGTPPFSVAPAVMKRTATPFLPRQTALSNLLAVLQGKEQPPAAQRHAWETLARFYAAELAQKRTEQLSGGEQQRVSLARAFAVKSDVVLLDEPTASMDVALSERVTEQICAFAKQRLVILASHSAAQLAAADAKIVLGE